MLKKLNVTLNILTIVAVIGFGISVIYAIDSIEEKKDRFYQVQFKGQKHWTRDVMVSDDGMVQFIDEESKRNYKVKSDYIIVEPKSK